MRFYKVISQKDFDEMHRQKSPKDRENYVGIELEFFSKANTFELNQHFIHNKLADMVTVKSDGSIRPKPGTFAVEINILCKEKNYKRIVFKVCEILKKVEAQVNSSCGFHVHLDMRNRRDDKDRIFANLVKAQPLLYSINPESRQTGGYSKPTENANFRSVYRDRTGINPCSYEKHSTFEVRIHSGTVNKYKITNWINILLKIVNFKGDIRTVNKLDDLKKTVRLGPNLCGYVEKRLTKYKVDKNQLKKLNIY